MGNPAPEIDLTLVSEEGETKLLGAHVDIELHRQFKIAATMRNEGMREAIEHAARMYIESGPNARERG